MKPRIPLIQPGTSRPRTIGTKINDRPANNVQKARTRTTVNGRHPRHIREATTKMTDPVGTEPDNHIAWETTTNAEKDTLDYGPYITEEANTDMSTSVEMDESACKVTGPVEYIATVENGTPEVAGVGLH